MTVRILLFNLGALTATLLSIVFSDRAFGWQTTLQIDLETLYQYIRLSSFNRKRTDPLPYRKRLR